MTLGFVNVTCGKCGHVVDLDAFCRTPIFGELPKGEHQCPACGVAFKRMSSELKVYRIGSGVLVVPGKVELIPVGGRL